MVTEKELISKLKELRQIKPEKEWVSLAKTSILGETPGFYLFPFLKLPSASEGGRRKFTFFAPALAGLVSVLIFFGVFAFSQNAVPGDFLYSVKKIKERSQSFFVSEQERPQASLESAQKRLKELTKIAETNQGKKLPQAINEFQASASEVAKSFSKTEGIGSNSEAIKKIVELDKNKQILEQTLATKIETEELDNTYKNLAEYLISDFGTRTLTEDKEEVLSQMKELAKQEKYLEVLELLPLINE